MRIPTVPVLENSRQLSLVQFLEPQAAQLQQTTGVNLRVLTSKPISLPSASLSLKQVAPAVAASLEKVEAKRVARERSRQERELARERARAIFRCE